MRKLLLPLSAVLFLSLDAADRLDCTDEIAKTPAKAFEYVVACDRPDGIYRCGETATVNVRVRNAMTGAPVRAGKVRVELDALDNRVFRTEEHDLAKEGGAFAVTATLAKPGFLRLKLHKDDEAKFKPWCVAFDPDDIPPGVDDPADFDAFWANAYARYEKNVPFDFELRFDSAQTTPWNDVYRFSFAAPDGKTRLYGFVSYPKDRTKRYPARFEVPSAGVGSWTLGPSTYQRDRTVNVLLNIFPFEMPKTVKEANVPYQAWCKELKEKYHCNHYMSAGMGVSREEATLYNYFLGAKRCIEWLYAQPEVDTSRFCYWGASQGGGYGTCVVGLSGRFTKAVVCVPCLVHDLGRFGREASGGGSNVQAMHADPKERAVAAANWPYFSAENFARRIRCETMVTVGFCDPTCAPHGGWSIYNLIPAEKKSIVGAVNQPHGPPDPVWYGTQEWLLGFSGWRETFGPQFGYVHGAAVRPAERPYELDWANRTADEFPPVARLENAAGWTVRGAAAEVSLSDAAEYALFGAGTARVEYRVTGERPSFTFAPEKSLPCPDGFDTLSVWLRATNVRGPHLDFRADFRDAAGKPFSLELGKVRHDEWHCEVGVIPPSLRERAAKGASFAGFTVSGGTNGYSRTFDFTSLCLFRDPQRPLPKTARAKRGVQLFKDQPQGHNVGEGRLPFPNRADTMMPPRKEVAGLEFRLPDENAVAWDELAFRTDGGEWIPLAVGGGLYPRSAAAGAKVRFHREANSVVADVEAEAGVEEVSFGSGRFPPGTELVGWPYFTLAWCDRYDIPGYESGGIYRPKTAVFGRNGRTICVGAMFDWTQSGASAPTCRDDTAEGRGQLCCGLMYVPKTDGRRNRVFERYVWTVGEEPADVFPAVPNPDSPWKHVTGAAVWRAHPASDDRQDDYRFWQSVRDAGMMHVIVTDHEKMWRDGNESFTFRTKTAPKKGGDKGAADYARFMIDKLGFRYGPYNNFTDYAAVNGNWALDRVGRRWDGSLVTAWNRCYSPKSTWAVGMCERLVPILKEKYGFDTAYCDVHTCVTPWLRCDYDCRAPGAGTFAQVFYDYGEIMLLQKAAWNGPVYSEGGFHWWYCGLTDGNYAQDSTYGISDNPWLVDFDLRRMHDKCCNFGMGNPGMFFGSARTANVRKDPSAREASLMRFLAATIAFGHPGFLVCDPKEPDLDEAKTSYFLVQGIAAKYTQASVRDVRYADAAGRLFAPAEALLNGAAKRSQVFVRYSDGTEVAVNGSRTERFGVTVSGRAYDLPPNGWAAVSGDRRAGSLNVLEDGVVLQRAWSPEYGFSRKGGKVAVSAHGEDGRSLALPPSR